MTNKRLKLVDFSYPLGMEDSTILTADQTIEHGNDLIYFNQVDVLIWICVLIIFILIMVQNSINKIPFIDNLFHAVQIMVRAGYLFIYFINLTFRLIKNFISNFNLLF